jgi:PucR family transcriptional regulator, proline-responsive transcriptional activator
MAVKLNQLLSSVKDISVEIVAGKQGLERIVRWVHMVESIDISVFLEGEEVAFTTGIALSKPDELFDLVRHTYHNGASGMVINIGPYIKEVTQEILDFADSHDFPLLVVPWHEHMANIMRTFCYEITVADKNDMELSSAIRHAIFFPAQEELYVPHLERYNYTAEAPYCIAIIDVNPGSQGTADKDKVLKMLENIILFSYKEVFIFEQDDKIALFFAKHSYHEIKTILKDIVEKLYARFRGNEQLYLGVGRITKSIRCLGKSYNEAIRVLGLQKKQDNHGEVVLYEDLGLYKLLLSIDDRVIIKEYYNETIQPLVRYDELNNTNFTEALSTYLKYNGSTKKAAEVLFVHRNTINYRIDRIEEILDCDLSDLKTRMACSVGLMVRELL